MPPLPDAGFQRVLCVAAHPDDLEYGTSAAIAKWVAQGAEVTYLLLTAGEAGMQIPPEETGPLRAREQRAACDVAGVGDLEILDYPDGMLVYGLDLRRSIARKIRQVRPDVVVTGPWEVESPWGLDQADHRAAGLATLDAVRDADNTWVFRDLAEEEGLAKHAVRWFLVAGRPHATHGVDVTGDPLTKGVASLECHREYLAAIPGHPAAADFIPMLAATAARAMGGPDNGIEHAVLFRAWDLQAPPPVPPGTGPDQ